MIGLPALLIAFSVLAGLWRQTGEEHREAGEENGPSAASMEEATA